MAFGSLFAFGEVQMRLADLNGLLLVVVAFAIAMVETTILMPRL